jgi:hypothetical protein
MHRDRHPIGDAYLFNDQVGKIGKYGHRLLIVDEEMVVLEILFCPLFYHIAIIEPAEEPLYGSKKALHAQISELRQL